jgi:CheY-like chemotaxis protein
MLRLLEDAGACVRVVDSAQAARRAYRDKPPHLLLSDIGMPGEDGYALLNSIRELEKKSALRRVPAVAITAFASQEDRNRAFEAGFDDHLSKPLDDGLLLTLLAGLAGRAPGRQDNN